VEVIDRLLNISSADGRFSFTEHVGEYPRATYTRYEDATVPVEQLAQAIRSYHGFTAANLAGNDHIWGGGGRLLGYAGNDTLSGSYDKDTLAGGTGNDVLHGGDGSDSLQGAAGDDDLHGDAGNDVARGDAGVDTLSGGDGSDSLYGGADNDFLNGDAGSDAVRGEAGHDTLRGCEGADSLYGGAGNDVLYGDGGDRLEGGAGNDTYLIDSAGDVVAEAGGTGDEVRSSIDAFTLPAGVERLTLVGEAVRGTGNVSNNVLSGNGQDNVLDGGGGRDTLVGGAGDDSFVFGRLKGQFSKIVDFDADGDDVIALSGAFASLFDNGALRSDALSTDGIAHGIGPQLIYKDSTGSLYYDANGARAGGATEIASFASKPAAESIGADDFVLIS